MVRDGIFKGSLDVCLAWHPDSKIRPDVHSTQALVDFVVEFRGRTSHAAFDPWNGRSAVDGLEAFTHGVNMSASTSSLRSECITRYSRAVTYRM